MTSAEHQAELIKNLKTTLLTVGNGKLTDSRIGLIKNKEHGTWEPVTEIVICNVRQFRDSQDPVFYIRTPFVTYATCLSHIKRIVDLNQCTGSVLDHAIAIML